MKAKHIFIILLLLLMPIANSEAADISLIIDHPSISPNGDGSKDFSKVEMTLSKRFDSLTVTLRNTAETEIHDSLISLTDPEPSLYSFFWTGRDSLDNLLDDGEYLIFLRAVKADTVTETRRTVIVDTEPPMVHLDRIEPGIYSPALPGGRVLIYYTVSGYSTGCTAGGLITDPEDGTTELDLGVVETDSSYIYEWDPISPKDGIYTVTLNIEDLAGNRGTDEGHISVDAKGPIINIDPVNSPTSDPPPFMSGNCYDRSTVDSLRFTWRAGAGDANQIFPDTVYTENDTTYWNVSIYDSIYSPAEAEYIEKTYTLSVNARDSLNQSENSEMSFTVDITPPDPPSLVQPTSVLLKPEIGITYGEALGAGVMDVQFYIQHQGVTDSTTKSAFNPNPIIYLNEGITEIWARAIDQAENISGSSNRIRVEYRNASISTYPEVFRGPEIFRVSTAEDAYRVRIRIFTLEGEEVRTMVEDGPSEYFELEWDLTTNDGEEVRNGAYLLIITTSFYNTSSRTEKEFISVVR